MNSGGSLHVSREKITQIGVAMAGKKKLKSGGPENLMTFWAPAVHTLFQSIPASQPPRPGKASRCSANLNENQSGLLGDKYLRIKYA
jgi:hypothetical protein